MVKDINAISTEYHHCSHCNGTFAGGVTTKFTINYTLHAATSATIATTASDIVGVTSIAIIAVVTNIATASATGIVPAATSTAVTADRYYHH